MKKGMRKATKFCKLYLLHAIVTTVKIMKQEMRILIKLKILLL